MLVDKRQFFIPFVFNLHDTLERLRIFELLGGAKILPKSSSLCLVCNNVTDDRRAGGRLMGPRIGLQA